MQRAGQKERTHQRIVDKASRLFREHGLSGAGVQRIMKAIGLTHGGFYSHFNSKTALIVEAINAAMAAKRAEWLTGIDDLPADQRLPRLVARYLSRAHRDAPGLGCPLPATAAEVARAPEAVRRAYETALLESIAVMQADPGDEHAREQAIAAVALCVGGLLLARAVADQELSDEILISCRRFASDTLGDQQSSNQLQFKEETHDEKNRRM